MTWIALFCAGVALPLYTLFVYPALLGVLSRWRARPVDSKPQRKTVSVIIPVRNGERFLAAKLRSVLDLEYPKDLLETLVVSEARRTPPMRSPSASPAKGSSSFAFLGAANRRP